MRLHEDSLGLSGALSIDAIMETVGTVGLVVAGIWLTIGIGFYIWYLAALARLFPHIQLPAKHGWIPLWNDWRLISRAGLPGWTVLLFFIPVLGLVPFIIRLVAVNRINSSADLGAGYTVLFFFLPPLWATLLGSIMIADQSSAPRDGPGVRRRDQPAPYGQGQAFGAPAGGGFAVPQSTVDRASQTQALPPLPPQYLPAQSVPPAQPAPPAPVPQPPPPAARPPAGPPLIGPQAPLQAPPKPPETGIGGPGQGPAAPAAPAASSGAMPWEQPSANDEPGGYRDPTPTDQWGLSSTTEREFERLAAEEFQAPPAVPLAPQAAPRPFSWPGQDAAAHGASLQAPPVHPAATGGGSLDDGVQEDSAFVSGESPAREARLVDSPEPPVPPRSPSPEEVRRRAAAAAAAAGAHASPESAGDAEPDDDLDNTIVAPRASRQGWRLVLPDGERLPILSDDIIVGRKPKPVGNATTLLIPDATRTLSKSHARLRYDGTSWSIEDLHSTNGVTLVRDGEEREVTPGRPTEATSRLILGTLPVQLRREGGPE